MSDEAPERRAKPWGMIGAAFLVTELAMIACAYAWVFFYSVFVNSSADEAFYQAYAELASPFVAVIVAFPIFYLMGRFMRRYKELARFTALAVVVINLVIDSLIIILVAPDLGFILMMSVLSATGKISGAYLGSRTEITP